MTKADLRSGMEVTCRNGRTYLVMRDAVTSNDSLIRTVLVGIGKKPGSWLTFDNYRDDLSNVSGEEWTIMEVAEFKDAADIPSFFSSVPHDENLNLLWKRPNKKKYTYEQLKEILGEEFEIVKE